MVSRSIHNCVLRWAQLRNAPFWRMFHNEGRVRLVSHLRRLEEEAASRQVGLAARAAPKPSPECPRYGSLD